MGVKDIGSSENSAALLVTVLDAKNALIPEPARRFSEEAKAEKILRCVGEASRLFSVETTTELNAIEGPRGVPGVRRFQTAPNQAGVRARDVAGVAGQSTP